jgi:microcystin-dependent protein
MDQFLAEIRIFGCNFAPKSWALCNGQLMPISQNTALFSLLGTNYGGNGTTTFALPNLQGTAALGQGQGSGLSDYVIGEQVGSSTVTLISGELAPHNHNINCNNAGGSEAGPGADILSVSGTDARGNVVYNNAITGATVNMNPAMLQPTGGNGAHNNMSPYLTNNYCIALSGVYPQRP